MAEQNVKKIRDLESFNETQPITTEDLLIVASTQGDPVTNKASIKEVIDVYNASIVEESPDSQIEDPEDPEKTIKDPELAPGIENDLDGDGEPDEKLDITPINAGNFQNFLDPNGGIEIVQECRTKGTKELVPCDDPTAYYKTKKISTSGFDGYPIVRRKGGFLAETHYYKAGILKEIYYGKGKFLEYFDPLGDGWFSGSYEDNPDFQATIMAPGDDEENYWVFWMELGNKWVYWYPVPKYNGFNDFKESFWLWQENLGWFFILMEHYPWIYVEGTFPDSEEKIGWVYVNSNNPGELWIASLEEWRNINDLSVVSSADNGGSPAPLTGGFPTVSGRDLTGVPSNQPTL